MTVSPAHQVALLEEKFFAGPLLVHEGQYHHKLEQAMEEHELWGAPGWPAREEKNMNTTKNQPDRDDISANTLKRKILAYTRCIALKHWICTMSQWIVRWTVKIYLYCHIVLFSDLVKCIQCRQEFTNKAIAGYVIHKINTLWFLCFILDAPVTWPLDAPATMTGLTLKMGENFES